MTETPKGMLSHLILEILRTRTDETHKLTQTQIMKILADEYDRKADRKTVSNNLQRLVELDELSGKIECTISEKKAGNPCMTDFYFIPDFTAEEFRFLSDCIVSSKFISQKYGKDMIEKLKNYSQRSNVATSREYRIDNTFRRKSQGLFLNLQFIEEAVSKGIRIAATMCEYDIDGRLINIKPHKIVLNPYMVTMSQGWYYLVASVASEKKLKHFRIDKLSNVEILKKEFGSVTPPQEIEGINSNDDFLRYAERNIYMLDGETQRVHINISAQHIGDFMDNFCNCDAVITKDGDNCEISFIANDSTVVRWAMENRTNVKVIGPESIKNKIKTEISALAEMYAG